MIYIVINNNDWISPQIKYYVNIIIYYYLKRNHVVAV